MMSLALTREVSERPSRFIQYCGSDCTRVLIPLPRPRTQCFPSPEAHAAFVANTVLERGYDVGPNLTDPLNRDHLIAQQRDADALLQTQFQICAQTMGDQLKYMGTSTVVRDIDYITTLLEGQDALM